MKVYKFRKRLILLLIISILFAFTYYFYTTANSNFIKIGVIGPLTGSASAYGISHLNGAQLAVDIINNLGGINGNKIIIIAADDENDKIKAAEVAKKLILENKVVALLGSISSDNTMVIQRICEKTEIPIITAVSTNPFITRVNFRYSFRCLSDDTIQAKTLAEYVINLLNIRKIAIIHDSNKYGSEGARIFSSISKQMGASIVAIEEFNSGDSNFILQINNLLNQTPEAVLIWGLYREAGLITKQLREAGFKGLIFGPDGLALKSYISIAGHSSENIVVTYPFNPNQNNEKTKIFVEIYKQKYGQVPDSFAAHAFDGMMLILEAIKQVGYNPKLIRDFLASFKEYNGVCGKGGFDENGNETRNVELAKIVNGDYVQVFTNTNSSKN